MASGLDDVVAAETMLSDVDGLAGRLMELTGAQLAMHTLTDLDCEKYRHPDTARARRLDTYADHGVSQTGEAGSGYATDVTHSKYSDV